MQEMMQEHPDPADDSPPQSPDDEKVNLKRVGEFVTSNDVTSRDSECGDTSSGDVQLLWTKAHSDSFENSWDKLGQTDTLQTESEACWDTTASGDRLSSATEEQSGDVTSECRDSSQVSDSHPREKVSSSSCSKTSADEHTGTLYVAQIRKAVKMWSSPQATSLSNLSLTNLQVGI